MSPKTQVAISFLRANLHRSLTIADIAESVELSRSHLSYLFKNRVGASPVQYLKTVRFENARELLETSLMSVKRIAGEVGYNDCTHFMRDFKKVYGCMPSQYRAASLLQSDQDSLTPEGPEDSPVNRTFR